MELSVNLAKVLFQHEFNSFIAYINFMENFLEVEQKKEEETFQEILSRINPDDLIVYDGVMPRTIDEFAGMLRNSFFVSLYSFFENHLISECRSRKSDETLITYDDIRAPDDMERVKKYFNKVLRINFPSNTREWLTIHEYRILRNCLVHAQGKITALKDKSDREKLERYINKNEKLGLFRNDEEIYLERGFCEEACKTIETFLIMLLFSEDDDK